MDENTEQERALLAINKQHALALFQSGKAKTMQEAMAVASATSLQALPAGVRERLTGGMKKEYVEFLAGEPLSKEVPLQAPADAPDPMPNISIEDAVAYIEKASVEGIRVLPQSWESSASKTDDQQEDDEEEEIKAGFQRMLRYSLIAAGLLRPNRSVTPESIAIEKRLRQQAQDRLDDALRKHRAGKHHK